LLHGPIHGIGSHWDEWFRHEASADDRRAIEHVSQNKSEQRRFVAWLARHWAHEAEWSEARPPVRFVLGQLAHVSPFARWTPFERYRSTYGIPGISAVVLAEQSHGESGDVRAVEALTLPLDADGVASQTMPEGFQPDGETLTTARRAASSALAGRGLLVFLGLWIAGGRRPYPAWVSAAIRLGWLAVALLTVRLAIGPEPGERLTTWSAALMSVWAALMLTAVVVAAVLSFQAWRAGVTWRKSLDDSQVRIRMNGGLKLHGGSAGFAFCLDTLGALARANPVPSRRSWLWRRFFRQLRLEAPSWAATGAVTASGRVEPVVIGPKIRAVLQHAHIRHVLTPLQREAGQHAIDQLASAVPSATAERHPEMRLGARTRLGFASDDRRLRSHRCRHVAQSLMAIANLTSRWQLATSALALVVSVAMLIALPDLRSILWPPSAPAVTGPSSPSPYHLWVSLDTNQPDAFYVVLESGFWSNRRSTVAAYGGANASARAELRLKRLARPTTTDEEDGIIWVERRRRFLTREFLPGDLVGRYSFSYVTRLRGE
jgi:hypothetical protein